MSIGSFWVFTAVREFPMRRGFVDWVILVFLVLAMAGIFMPFWPFFLYLIIFKAGGEDESELRNYGYFNKCWPDRPPPKQ